MKDERKTKTQLIHELEDLRQRIAELEASRVERQRVEISLEEQRNRLRTIFTVTPDMLVLMDRDFAYVAVNPAFCRFVGLPEGELVGKTDFDVFPHHEAELYRRDDVGVLRSGDVQIRERQARDADGEERWLQVAKAPVLDGKGEATGLLVCVRDITQRKRAEEALSKARDELEVRVAERTAELARASDALRESEASFRALAENANDAIVIAAGEGELVFANHGATALSGYSVPELLNRRMQDLLHPDELSKVSQRYRKRLAGEAAPTTYETRIVRNDNATVPIELTAARTVWHGRDGVIAIIRDITERKRAEEQTKAALEEKEILLQEIHHRVKNNLQVVSSLLSLQEQHVTDAQTRDALVASRNRVRSMALIHERLYKSADMSRVCSSDYLRDLVESLLDSYGTTPGGVRLQMDLGDVSVDIDTAIPLALVANELISNCLRHAFPSTRRSPAESRLRPTIRVGLWREGDHKLGLAIADNGVGLPSDLDIDKAGSLGLQLVKMLVDQLGGTIEVGRSGGTQFRIMLQCGG